MKLKQLYEVKTIAPKLANEIQIKNHYLKTRASCTEAFGLFDKNTKAIIGVILYGNPTAPTTLKICGEQNQKNVVEITRLWIKDDTPRNAESFFIGATLKKVTKPIIVAFADPEVGHVGYVYQASNFLYTGKSERGGKVIAIKGSNIHNKTLWKQYKTAQKIREVFGSENVYYKEYVTKHRYIYFKDNKLKRELIYKVLPYPKKCTQL
jgi:hypothetical protein